MLVARALPPAPKFALARPIPIYEKASREIIADDPACEEHAVKAPMYGLAEKRLVSADAGPRPFGFSVVGLLFPFHVVSAVLIVGNRILPERPGECPALFNENPKRRDRLARRGERLKL